MIGAALAAALSLLAVPSAVQADVTGRDIGRMSFFAGVCSTIGWESSQERAMAAGEAWGASHTEASEAENVAQIELGVADGRSEVTALVQTFRSDRDAAAFGAALKTRCDALARDFPAVVNRAPDTDARFQATLAQIVQEETGR